MRPEERIGSVFGHYKLVRQLAVGGTAMVFLAQDINLQRDVALKLFQPQEGETRDFLRRFAREARIVAQLDHPNIVPVYDYGEQDDQAYLVMPYMSGSLRDRLQGHKILSPGETLAIVGPILNALQYAHDHDLIHRDIKPGNILFKADETPMLSDFGLVKVTTPSTDQTLTMNQTASISGNTITGTPDYMSPEQINGQVTPASDIYSFGVVLYEMLTGSRPFSADSFMGVLMKQVYEPPRSLRSVNPTISAPLEAVVLRALEKDATKRYQRPDELRRALELAIREQNPPIPITAPSLYATEPMPTAKQLAELTNVHSTAPALPFTPVMSPTHNVAYQNMQDNQPGYHLQQASYAPAQRGRSRTPLLVGLILLVLLLVGVLGTGLLAPPPLGFLHRTIQGQTHVGSTSQPKQTAITKGNITPTTAAGVTPTAPVTQNVPATTTACPASGTARAAVTAPLALGSHHNVIYIVNQFSGNTPMFGTIKRHDVDTGAKGTEIANMAGIRVTEAQVSQDGQWVLFVAQVGSQFQIRLVRVDGQGLQTLYCGASGDKLVGSQWSFNQQQVIFAETNQGVINLLDLQTGNVQAELVPQGQLNYLPRTWLDKTHVYLLGTLPSASANLQGLYLLDIERGNNQHDSDLKQVAKFPQQCDSFDTSYDLTQLFLSTCTSNGTQTSFNGPSAITTQAIAGGTAKTIYSSSTNAITMVRSVTPNTLLVMIENSTGNTSQNGLWKINSDGSNPTRLSTDATGSQSLCPYSQYAWSNISRDSTMYALESYQSSTNTYALYYGSLSGGQPTQFASINDGTQILLAGWTTM